MARIPVIRPGSAQLVSPQVSTQSPQAKQGRPIGISGGLKSLGGTIAQTANVLYKKLDDSRRFTENSRADLYKTDYMAQLRLSESQKRNADGTPLTDLDLSDFQEGLNRGRENLTTIYTDSTDLVVAQANWDKDSIVLTNDVIKERYKNMAVVGDVNTRSALQKKSEFFDGSKEAIKGIKDLTAEAVASNIWDTKKAYDEEQKALKLGNQNWFRRTAKIDRDKAKQMLENGEFGFDQKETDTALSTLNHYKNLEDKDVMLNKVNGRYDLVEAIATGQESLYELSPEAQELINSDDVLAEAVSKATRSRTGYYADTANEGIVKVFKEASKAETRDSLSRIAASAIYRNKNISADKLGAILFYARKKSVNLQLSEKLVGPIGDETTEAEIYQKQVDYGINAIARWARDGSVTEDQHGFVISEYMKGLEKNETPLNAYKRVTNEANLKLNPRMANYPKEGQMLIDKNGNMKIGFPTGELKDVENKAIKKPKQETKEELGDFTFKELKGK